MLCTVAVMTETFPVYQVLTPMPVGNTMQYKGPVGNAVPVIEALVPLPTLLGVAVVVEETSEEDKPDPALAAVVDESE